MNDLLKGTGVKSICCTLQPHDYNALSDEDKQGFGFLVNQLRKTRSRLEEGSGAGIYSGYLG